MFPTHRPGFLGPPGSMFFAPPGLGAQRSNNDGRYRHPAFLLPGPERLVRRAAAGGDPMPQGEAPARKAAPLPDGAAPLAPVTAAGGAAELSAAGRDALEQHLVEGLRVFGSRSYGMGHSLVGQLCTAMASDPGVLEVLRGRATVNTDPSVPIGIFLASVHDELMQHPDDPLARFYPSVGGERYGELTHEAVHPALVVAFNDFCARHETAIVELFARQNLQTNAVNRCALLLPVVAHLAASLPAPVGLVDLGTSAALLTQMDRFGYRWGGVSLGTPSACVQVRCEVRGRFPFDWPAAMPAIGPRVGIDRSPIRSGDEAGLRWLRACVWPEDTAQRIMLDCAIADLQQAGPERAPRIVQGDFIDELPAAVAAVAAQGAAPMIVSSYALGYVSDVKKATLVRQMEALSQSLPGPLACVLLQKYDVFNALAGRELLQCHGSGRHGGILGAMVADHGRVSLTVYGDVDPQGEWAEPYSKPLVVALAGF